MKQLNYKPNINSFRWSEWYFLLFLQICTFLQGATVHWIDEQSVPYAIKGNEWVGFDNKQSYQIKVINNLIWTCFYQQ